MKKAIILMLSITAVMITTIFSVSLAKEFPDVEATHWAHQYISELAEQGVINGYDDGTYKPGGTVKRSEFIKLVMASCWPNYIDYDEVPTTLDHWAAPFVGLAEIDGVLDTGAYTKENIEEPITRIEMVRIISKADMYELENPAQYGGQLSFVDVGNLDTYDRSLLKHAVARGLITGYDDGTFKPDKTMTRAEAATMIWRFNNSKEVTE